jgi:hypothetical protein
VTLCLWLFLFLYPKWGVLSHTEGLFIHAFPSPMRASKVSPPSSSLSVHTLQPTWSSHPVDRLAGGGPWSRCSPKHPLFMMWWGHIYMSPSVAVFYQSDDAFQMLIINTVWCDAYVIDFSVSFLLSILTTGENWPCWTLRQSCKLTST